MDLSLSKRSWHSQIGAFVVLSASAVFGFWTLYVTDMQADMEIRRTRLAAVRSEMAKGLPAARRLPEFQAQVADLEQRLDSLNAALPEQKDVADILRRVQELATRSNLTIQRFTPQAPKPQALYTELPYKLQADGTYHGLGAFLDTVARFHRILSVSEISIKAKPQQQPNASIVAECIATTFVLQGANQATPGAAAGRKAPASASTAPPAYSYEVEGRRDPFVSLIGSGTDPKTMTTRPSGLPGVLISEIDVKGIMKDRGGFIAMLKGPERRTYMVRSGEKLLDGSVKAVTAEAVILLQNANDPLSVGRPREIVRKLRRTDGGGQ